MFECGDFRIFDYRNFKDLNTIKLLVPRVRILSQNLSELE